MIDSQYIRRSFAVLFTFLLTMMISVYFQLRAGDGALLMVFGIVVFLTPLVVNITSLSRFRSDQFPWPQLTIVSGGLGTATGAQSVFIWGDDAAVFAIPGILVVLQLIVYYLTSRRLPIIHRYAPDGGDK